MYEPGNPQYTLPITSHRVHAHEMNPTDSANSVTNPSLLADLAADLSKEQTPESSAADASKDALANASAAAYASITGDAHNTTGNLPGDTTNLTELDRLQVADASGLSNPAINPAQYDWFLNQNSGSQLPISATDNAFSNSSQPVQSIDALTHQILHHIGNPV